MQHLTDIITILLTISGGITAIGGAVAVLHRWWNFGSISKNTKKILLTEKRIEGIEKRMEVSEHMIQKSQQEQKETSEFIKIICNSMLALLHHNITGNSIDKLKEAETELQNYLINK